MFTAIKAFFASSWQSIAGGAGILAAVLGILWKEKHDGRVEATTEIRKAEAEHETGQLKRVIDAKDKNRNLSDAARAKRVSDYARD